MAQQKEEQKKLLTEIMETDAKDGLYKQQTAVEWFWIHLEDSISKEYFDLFQQAKQIEKEQIIEAYCDGFKQGSEGNRILSEEYYNETYKNN
jgi:hypothetical protein